MGSLPRSIRASARAGVVVDRGVNVIDRAIAEPTVERGPGLKQGLVRGSEFAANNLPDDRGLGRPAPCRFFGESRVQAIVKVGLQPSHDSNLYAYSALWSAGSEHDRPVATSGHNRQLWASACGSCAPW